MMRTAFLLPLALLAGGAAAAAEKAATPAGTLAIVDGLAIGEAEVEAASGGRLAALRNQEYEVRRQILDDLIATRLIEKEAKAKGIAAEELIKQEVEAKAGAVGEDEVKATYEQAKGRYPGKSEQELSALIRDSKNQQRRAQRRIEYARELRARIPVKLLLQPPRIEVAVGDDPSKGPQNAPVTIVEFSDYQCPYCSRVEPTLRQVEERYGDRIRLVFRDFPLPIHPQAPKAAEAAACANEQGKFWEMHGKLFATQANLQVPDLKQRAIELGLDAKRFDECLDSGRFESEWRQDLDQAQKYGITGTPAFFINGRLLSGARPFEDFVRIIDEELERAGLPVPPPSAPKPVAQQAKPSPEVQ